MSARNEWDSDYMKRIPRSMQQAFGAYTSNQLDPMPERQRETSSFEIAVYIVALIAVMAVVHLAA